MWGVSDGYSTSFDGFWAWWFNKRCRRLDAVYMEKLRKDGIDEDLLAQFRDLTLELEKDKEQNG